MGLDCTAPTTLAFATERESDLSLAINANVVRVLYENGGITPVPEVCQVKEQILAAVS